MSTAPADRRSTALPLALLAVWLLATAWWRPLLLPDEGRYASVAREMLMGDGLVPTLAGLPFFHKPPLTYWVDLAGMAVFGPTAFAARLAPALGAWLMGAALFLAMRRWHGPAVATIALTALATVPFFFVGGQYVNHDMLVAGLIAVAVLCFARAVDEGPRPVLGWVLAGWAACGFALLAKGLIGLVLPAFVLGPWLLVQGRWRELLRLVHPLGLLVFAAVGLPWFAWMQAHQSGFFDYFVMEQHFRRYAQATFNNRQPAWFYVAVLPALTLPWSGFAVAALPRAWRERARLPRDPALLLYAWWTVAILFFFSLPASKLVGYILPALAPWCALLALAAQRNRAWRHVGAVGAALCIGAVAFLAIKAPHSNRPLARELAAQLQPGERVVFVDEMFYDVPFDARLPQPPVIASDWSDPEIPRRDNWRKELFDAGRFDPARARTTLWPLARIGELRCGVPAAWFVVPKGQSAKLKPVDGAERRFEGRDAELWRAAGAAC